MRKRLSLNISLVFCETMYENSRTIKIDAKIEPNCRLKPSVEFQCQNYKRFSRQLTMDFNERWKFSILTLSSTLSLLPIGNQIYSYFGTFTFPSVLNCEFSTLLRAILSMWNNIFSSQFFLSTLKKVKNPV